MELLQTHDERPERSRIQAAPGDSLAVPDLESMSFGDLEIVFDTRVLRPRPWTVQQSAWAAELLEDAPPGPVLELCAGAGQIGLLAVAPTDRTLVCVDANPVAVAYAGANAFAAGMAARVEIREGDLQAMLAPGETFALVIADPPWVPRGETGRFPEDPTTAIDGGEDGLDVARACLEIARRHLVPGGSALLQLGSETQAGRVRDELAGPGLQVEETRVFPGSGVLVRLSPTTAGDETR